jgi:hypothetical protein
VLFLLYICLYVCILITWWQYHPLTFARESCICCVCYLCVCMHACTYVCCQHNRPFICMCICIHAYTNMIHTHTHTYTHTYTALSIIHKSQKKNCIDNRVGQPGKGSQGSEEQHTYKHVYIHTYIHSPKYNPQASEKESHR